MITPAAIADALAIDKRAGLSFDQAWQRAVGPVPPKHLGPGSTETVDHATYRFMRDAYLGIGRPAGLDREMGQGAEHEQPTPGKSRRFVA